MQSDLQTWSAEVMCGRFDAAELLAAAETIYARVARVDFEQPGFFVMNLGRELDSVAFRGRMVELISALSKIHLRVRSVDLAVLSAARFDQQTTTKPHLDGGPEESLLLLGYEPSAVDSELEFVDFARAAYDSGMQPKEFLARHNPMFRAGREKLAAYSHVIPCFDAAAFNLVLVNNSSANCDGRAWQGVLHTATIPRPDESQRRVINSMQIAPTGAATAISAAELAEFVATSAVRRRGYDKSHLSDDS